MVLLFVVCGWREEAVAGVFLRMTWYILHTFFWLPGQRGKIVKPTVLFLYVLYVCTLL
jgi:hypothetical protein